jgi:serine/threonine protein kinase
LEADVERRHYRLRQRIAIGGMAEVFLATLRGAEGFERRVVVKRILSRWSHHPDVLSLFRDEARLGAQLDHHNIVQVLDYGNSEGSTYLVLEYVDGRNLAELLACTAERRERLPPTLVAWIGSEVCAALDHIHRRMDRGGSHLGVVHRDINLANILLSRSGEVKLTDFGVAAGHHRELKTAHGILRGTFPYMSPEQTLCRPLDGRSDVFSLGICLYETLTGQHPFASEEDYLTIQRIQEHEPTWPSDLRDDLDPALAAIVMRCLSKDVDDRYASATAFQDDLVAWLRARRAVYGSGRLAQLMEHYFGDARPAGDKVDPVDIALGPTTPGSVRPLLDVSKLDEKSGGPRVGGAIYPREPAPAEEWQSATSPDGSSPLRGDIAQRGGAERRGSGRDRRKEPWEPVPGDRRGGEDRREVQDRRGRFRAPADLRAGSPPDPAELAAAIPSEARESGGAPFLPELSLSSSVPPRAAAPEPPWQSPGPAPAGSDAATASFPPRRGAAATALPAGTRRSLQELDSGLRSHRSGEHSGPRGPLSLGRVPRAPSTPGRRKRGDLAWVGWLSLLFGLVAIVVYAAFRF